MFRQLRDTPLYLPDGLTEQTARTAYLMPKGASLPQTLDLQTALIGQAGCFLHFTHLPQGNAGVDGFVNAVYGFLAVAGRKDSRFAWIENPQAVSLNGQVLRAVTDGNGLVTQDAVGFDFANYILQFVQQNRIIVNSVGDSLLFSSPQKGGNQLQVTPMGSQPLVSFPLTDAVEMPLLTDDTAIAGVFAFALTVDHGDLASLDVGLRYFMSSQFGAGYVDSLRYPVFDLARDTQQLSLYALWDVLAPLEPTRSLMRVGAEAPVASFFSNPVGKRMLLTPRNDAALVFAPLIRTEAPEGSPDGSPDFTPFYLVPSGGFTMAVDAPPQEGGGEGISFTHNLMCGISAVEYIDVQATSPILSFVPGKPAFSKAEYRFDNGALSSVRFSALTDVASTAWAYVSSEEAGKDLPYLAQPDSSVLYGIADGQRQSADESGADFLSYLPLQAGVLPSLQKGDGAKAHSFPMVAYSGIEGEGVLRYRELEMQILNPTRRSVIYTLKPQEVQLPLHYQETIRQGTTPQGLLLSLDGTDWQSLTLAQSQYSNHKDSLLQLYNVTGPLKAALQSNQIFLVISNPQALLECCSVRYSMTDDVLEALRVRVQVPQDILTQLQALNGQVYTSLDVFHAALFSVLSPYILTEDALSLMQAQDGLPQAVADKLRSYGIVGKTYNTIEAWNAQLQAALSEKEYADWGSIITPYAVHGFTRYGAQIVSTASDCKLVIQDWEFNLSPYLWSSKGTVLVFKYLNKPMQSLVDDLTTWAHADIFNSSVNATQQALQQIIKNARSNPELDYFRTEVMENPAWNGIIALNATVPLTGLPEQLRGLAAGIDPALFSAHHVGVNVTPVTQSANGMQTGNSTLFALIDYENTELLKDNNATYQFKVLYLKVLMANSIITRFASQVDLLVNQLFGDGVMLQGSGSTGNNLIFDGVYQKHGDSGTYIFSNEAVNNFTVQSKVLDAVVVRYAQFITLSPEPDANTHEVKARFLFSGVIAFDAVEGFDIFSYGDAQGGTITGLSYSSLTVDMTFNDNSPAYKTFRFNVQEIMLEPTSSLARPASLYQHFPLTLVALQQGDGSNRPDKGSFMPVDSPLSSAGIKDEWYGLLFNLNLGSLGALAGKAGFVGSLMLAWSPSAQDMKVFMGLGLPGVKGGERAISLQGVIKLSFGDVMMQGQNAGYILQLRNIALKILGISLPPSGQTNLVLFGDPSGKSRDTLGWYGAYVKDGATDDKKEQEERSSYRLDRALHLRALPEDKKEKIQ